MNDYNTIFNLLNLTIALIFGIATIYLYFRTTRRIRITYVEEDCISLFHSVIQNIEGMVVSYKEKAITTPHLFKINGGLINDGNADIDQTNIFKSPRIKIPEGFKCIDVGIIPSSQDIETRVKIVTDNEVEIEWDLLKKNEFIKFSLLIEALRANKNLEKHLSSKLTLTHRISGLSKITRESIAILQKPQKLLDEFQSILVFIGLGIIIMSLGIWPPTSTSGLVLQDKNGNEIQIQVYPSLLDRISRGESRINSLKGFLRDDIDIIKERTKLYTYEEARQLFRLGFIWALCGLWNLIKKAFKIYRQRKLKRILNL